MMKHHGLPSIHLLLAVALACATGGDPAAAADRPNILFAIADDWGWPHASAYGDPVVRTPAFDRIASEGALFTHAFVSSPSCTPSRGAIITGQHFFRLGAAANLWSHWPEGQHPEYPALLAKAGYHVGSYRKGWGPGDPHGANPAGKRYRSTEAFFDARPDDAPFCLWFGASDPHRPYRRGSGRDSGMDIDRVHRFPWFPDAEPVKSDIADYYFEVQRFDRELGRLLARLEQTGELENTLIIVTGDHGMPFPRCKANVYDAGARVPLAIRWPANIPPSQTISALVSLTDIAPTILAAADLPIPDAMTGRNLLPLLAADNPGLARDFDSLIIGRERHVPAQQAPIAGGYPVRALRTRDFLYIRNDKPGRWPAGTPDHDNAYIESAWLADCDNGLTKTYLWKHRNDPAVKPLYDLTFAKRPAEELYDLRGDPHQINNLADDPDYRDRRTNLAARLDRRLRAAEDPRALGRAHELEGHEYLGGAPKWPFD